LWPLLRGCLHAIFWAMTFSALAQARTIVYVSNAQSRTISVAELDLKTGDLIPLQTVFVKGMVMPLAVTPDHRFLFAALRSEPHVVASFAIDPQHGLLTYAGEFPLPGSMASITVDRSGHLLFGASYEGHVVSVSRITPQGEVHPAHQILATPRHPHTLQAAIDNRFAFATSLGGDVVLQFRLDIDKQVLITNKPSELTLPKGSGPRHMAFHPNGVWLFVLDELDAQVHTLQIDPVWGTLRRIASHRSLPQTFIGSPSAADIHITPDGRFLITSDRGSNTLTSLQVDASNGRLSTIGQWPSEDRPRGFKIDPSGQFVIEVGQRSGQLSVHLLQTDGQLVHKGRWPVGQGPNWVEVVQLSP
jgi:6-phosphogluconolactonase